MMLNILSAFLFILVLAFIGWKSYDIIMVAAQQHAAKLVDKKEQKIDEEVKKMPLDDLVDANNKLLNEDSGTGSNTTH